MDKQRITGGEGYIEGVAYKCRLCEGMGIAEIDEGVFEDCPRCVLERRHGVIFEVSKRAVTTCSAGRMASPAVGADSYIYEVYEIVPAQSKARIVACEADVADAYEAKHAAEDEAYGPMEGVR